MLKTLNTHMLAQASAARPASDALNSKIVQAVQLSNAETMAYAPSQIVVGSNMLISQASGLIAQSAAVYFDGVSKMALASLESRSGQLFRQRQHDALVREAAGIGGQGLAVGTTVTLR